MSHELVPRDGVVRKPSEVVDSLSTEFRHVAVDAEEGLRQATRVAERIERAPASAFLGKHQQALEWAARLRKLKLGDALTIEFGDGPGKTLRTTVLPGEPVRFGYGSKDEEQDLRELLERCARVLNCEVVVI